MWCMEWRPPECNLFLSRYVARKKVPESESALCVCVCVKIYKVCNQNISNILSCLCCGVISGELLKKEKKKEHKLLEGN